MHQVNVENSNLKILAKFKASEFVPFSVLSLDDQYLYLETPVDAEKLGLISELSIGGPSQTNFQLAFDWSEISNDPQQKIPYTIENRLKWIHFLLTVAA